MQTPNETISHVRPAYNQALPLQVHLSDYLNILVKRKWTIIIFFLTVVGLVSFFSFRAQPVYLANAQIMIETQPSPLLNLEPAALKGSAQQEFYQTQCNLLRSRSLVCKVIKELNLEQYFKPPETGKEDKKQVALATETPPPASDSSKPEFNPLLINWYLSHLQITPIRGSSLINIGFLGSSPELITNIVNTHVRIAIEKNIKLQQSTAEEAFNWLKKQLLEQKIKVEASQRALYEYKKNNNIISLEDRQNIVSQGLMELNAALCKAETEHIRKQAVYNQLKSFSINQEKLFTMPEIARDPVVRNLRSRLVQLKAQQFEMKTNFGPKHPKMIELDSGIAQIQQELADEVNRIAKTIKADLDQAAAIENAIKKTLEARKQAAMNIDEKAINYSVLQRQAESNEQIYDILLKQSKEINLTKAMESSNVKIVDKAAIPSFPVKPRILLNLLLAVVLSLFMGSGLAFFCEYMDNTLKTPEDVARRLGINVIGALPYDKSLKRQTKPALTWEVDGAAGAGYPVYDISSRIPAAFRPGKEGLTGQVIVVESATMDEGKTTVLGNMALNLANTGMRVLLVDCDLQRPSIHQLFGIKNKSGLITSIDNIISYNIKSGKLDECSVADLFFLIGLKKQDGLLTIENDSQIMTACFQNGRLIHIQNNNNPKENRLGNMLVKGGFITKDQLQDAIQRHKRTKQPLGYILINSGYISRNKLQGPIKLQMEEHLQKLFSWKQGDFTFNPGNIKIYENERITFEDDSTSLIRNLEHLEGSKLLESEILSQIVSGNNDNVFILPAGRPSSRPIGQTNFTLMKKFMDILKQRFDLVIIDTPPLSVSAGTEALSSIGDGVIFVIKAGHLTVKDLNKAKNCIPDDKIIGAILNQVKSKENYYYR